jgi:ribosomal protein S7
MGYLKTKIANKYFNDKKQITSYIILKVIKSLMRSGKFEKFYNILIQGTKKAVIHLRKNFQIKINIIDLIIKIVTYLGPFCDVKAVRASGRKVLVPAPLRPQRKIMVAIKFLIHGFFNCSKKYGYPLIRAIREELVLLYFKKTNSEAFQKKQEFIRNIFYNEKNLRFLKGV